MNSNDKEVIPNHRGVHIGDIVEPDGNIHARVFQEDEHVIVSYNSGLRIATDMDSLLQDLCGGYRYAPLGTAVRALPSTIYHEITKTSVYRLIEEAFAQDYVGDRSVTDLLLLKDGKFLVVLTPDFAKQMRREESLDTKRGIL